MTRFKRMALALTMAGSFVVLLGARCVENDSVRRGDDNLLHIYGELYNETDIQGDDMLVQGSIFDADGKVLSSATAPTCPKQLSPGKPVVYDITLPDSFPGYLPEPTSHKVNVARGIALEDPLPELEIAPAITFTDTAGTVKIPIDFDSRPQITSGGFFLCVALYDAAGDVVAVPARDMGLAQAPIVKLTITFERAKYPQAVSARAWIYHLDLMGDLTSNYQPFVTDVLPIN